MSVLHWFLGRDRIASSDLRDCLSILRINDGELQVCNGTFVQAGTGGFVFKPKNGRSGADEYRLSKVDSIEILVELLFDLLSTLKFRPCLLFLGIARESL